MSDLVIGLAFAAFILFLVPGRHRRYAAVAGWCCIVANLFLDLPAFIQEANFLYPSLALLAVPFLLITVRHILKDDPVALRLSMSAAIATAIFVPFALVPALRDALIGIVINLVFLIVSALGHHPAWYAWDVMYENGFWNQIILGCTGILVIAMTTGVLAVVPGAPIRQRVAVIIPLALAFFILNLVRVAAVFIAVSDRWFDGFPDPTGTGHANFFWAHNVVAEALAIVFLLAVLALVVRILPGLRQYAMDVLAMYRQDLAACRNMFR